MSMVHTQLLPQRRVGEPRYPTRDGRPMGESDLHRNCMVEAIETLEALFEGQEVYVSGNILLFYEPGNRRKHVSPDVLVVKGLEPRERDNYLLWQEGKPPNVTIEVTSKSTKDEDLKTKHGIYRDKVKVREYFLFDPRSEYLDPPLQGFRLVGRRYVKIEPVDGRLPSAELGLHLEKSGTTLRFFDPRSGEWLPTPREALLRAQHQARAEKRRAEAEKQRAEAEKQRAESERKRAEAAERDLEAERQRAAAEIERLRREFGAVRQRKKPSS